MHNEALLLPDHYQNLCRMVASVTAEFPATTILELGCSNGHFVEYLRQYGYVAEGVDGNKRRVEIFNHRRGYLHHGELTALDNIFGEKLFDMIIAQGVFSRNAQLDYRFGFSGGIVYLLSSPEERKKLEDSLQTAVRETLNSSYRQLKAGRFLIVCENVSELDYVDFSQEDATDMGYALIHYGKQEAILQKPHI